MSDIVYEKNVFSTPFLSGYSELRIPILDDAGNSAWPQVFPLEKIEEMRRTVGDRHFSAQMMLDYVAPDKIRLDPGGIIIYNHNFDARIGKIGDFCITGAIVYWDPSSGKKNADNSVCVLIYRDDKNNRVFIHDILYLVVPDGTDYPLAYQCHRVFDFIRRHKQHTLAVETNGIGNALPEIMRNAISGTDYGVQIRPITNSRKKEDRILNALEPLLSSGRLYAHTRIGQTPFFSEMLSWSPLGGTEHDDGIDAVSGAVLTSPIPIRPLGTTPHRYIANTDFKI